MDSVLKLTKVHIVKAVVFPVVIHACESWTIKKAEHWRIDAFKLWWWRRLLRDTQTAKRSNLSILKEINPECSLKGLMLKLQNFGHLMPWDSLLEKTLMLGKFERKPRGDRVWDGITDSMDMSLNKLGCSEEQASLAFHTSCRHKESNMKLSNWTTIDSTSWWYIRKICIQEMFTRILFVILFFYLLIRRLF